MPRQLNLGQKPSALSSVSKPNFSASSQTVTAQDVIRRAISNAGTVTPAAVKTLQRTIGNRATVRLLSPMLASKGNTAVEERQPPEVSPISPVQSAAQPIQRHLIRHKPNGTTPLMTEEQKQGEAKATIVDNAVTKAFQEFKAGNYKGASDQQIALYVLRKRQFDQGDHSIHPSTAAGYVIEGKANQELQSKGFSIQVTTILPGTRPDIAFELPNHMYGLVDITASDSAGHIFRKKGNWCGHAHIPYVAESIYPSINFNDPTATASLSEEDIALATQRAQESAEWKAYVEQEIAADQERKFEIWQQTVIDQFEQYARIARTSPGGVNWRLTRREQGAWEEIGVSVNVDESASNWQVLGRLDYADWKEQHPGIKVSRADFDKVMQQINLKGRQKNDRAYYPGRLPLLGEKSRDEGSGGGAIRNRKARQDRDHPYKRNDTDIPRYRKTAFVRDDTY